VRILAVRNWQPQSSLFWLDGRLLGTNRFALRKCLISKSEVAPECASAELAEDSVVADELFFHFGCRNEERS